METHAKFKYFMPTRILFGPERLNVIGEEVARFGKRALLVTGKTAAKAHGYTQKVVDLLRQCNVETVIFDEVEPNPSNVTMNKGGELARSKKSDVVIGLGGGSAMDAAKGIAVVAVESKDVWNYVEGAQIEKDILPIVAVPTTAGTGSEVTPYSVVSNRSMRRKDAFASDRIFPRVAILDPLLTLTLSPFNTAATGMDTLAHAIEAYTSVLANYFSDLFAVEAIRLAGQNLRTAVSNGKDLDARANMLLANALAGVAIAHAETTIAHVIGEAVGAIYNTDHGTSVAVTLPAVMEYNCVSNLEKYARVTSLLGENTDNLSVSDAAHKAGVIVKNLLKDIGLPTSLSELGVTDINPVLSLATRPGLTATNPREIGYEEFKFIIQQSL